MRFVPFAGEALGFGDLRGRHLARNIVAKLHCLLPVFTGVSRRGEVVPQMGLHEILWHATADGVHDPEVV